MKPSFYEILYDKFKIIITLISCVFLIAMLINLHINLFIIIYAKYGIFGDIAAIIIWLATIITICAVCEYRAENKHYTIKFDNRI